MREIEELLANGEVGNVEFKEYLIPEVHLREGRRESLICQMNHRLLCGKGSAIYVIGVSDKGDLRGISEEDFNRTIFVLSSLAEELNAEISEIEKYRIEDGYIGTVTIRQRESSREHIVICTAGHVDHGKSTLIASLMTGECDDGSGKMRVYLDTLPHEIERGLSAELSYGILGFDEKEIIRMRNPLNKEERAELVKRASKIISFVDTVGHEPWLRTTIRGIVGQKIDYGLLVVSADQGVTHITREHLGIMFAIDLPVIITITKIDRVSEERVEAVEEEIQRILKRVGRIPMKVRSEEDAKRMAEMLLEDPIVPIIRTSAVTREGMELLEELLRNLIKRDLRVREPFRMYVDKVYNISGVGVVLSGTISQGSVRVGDLLELGPMSDGSFKRVRVSSIEIHHYNVQEARAGDVVGIAVRGVDRDEVRRGMVLVEKGRAVREFLAEVVILNHPTCIMRGYEPVVHMDTISESVIFVDMDREYLKAGERALVRLRFKFHPQYIYEGQKFIFREGRTKGIGKVVAVVAQQEERVTRNHQVEGSNPSDGLN